MFYIGYIWKHEKIFLSEIIRPTVLIFGMSHHLVDLNALGEAKNFMTCSSMNKPFNEILILIAKAQTSLPIHAVLSQPLHLLIAI